MYLNIKMKNRTLMKLRSQERRQNSPSFLERPLSSGRQLANVVVPWRVGGPAHCRGVLWPYKGLGPLWGTFFALSQPLRAPERVCACVYKFASLQRVCMSASCVISSQGACVCARAGACGWGLLVCKRARCEKALLAGERPDLLGSDAG